jgi:ferredoxin-type protein NapH
MPKQLVLRQRIRRGLLLLSFLLFPITLNYFSPYVIIDGASQGIINGSLIMFSLMFLSSLFVGRFWCGWLCPVGGFAENCFPLQAKPVKGRHLDWIKWFIWVPWIGIIIWAVVSAGGYHSVNAFLDTENGISIAGAPDRPIIFAYLIYYIVLGLFLVLSLLVGRRAGCHSMCWMAPFMIIGRKLRNLANWPALHLQSQPDRCRDCKQCTSVCPMSLDVNAMVRSGKMEHSECILCGSCVDNCPTKVIRYQLKSSG